MEFQTSSLHMRRRGIFVHNFVGSGAGGRARSAVSRLASPQPCKIGATRRSRALDF
jgi:hypothetical protein